MATIYTEDWRVSSSGNSCRECGVEFRENHYFFSGLAEQQEGFARHDFCPNCWSDDSHNGLFCFWRSRRAPSQKRPVVDTQIMFEFFDRLDVDGDDTRQTLRFVLALYLMRRKELKLVELRRADGLEQLVFQRRSTGEQISVRNPQMTEEQVAGTADQLGRLLNASL
jgi:hypothetical protein